jgi:hypothetical protein
MKRGLRVLPFPRFGIRPPDSLATRITVPDLPTIALLGGLTLIVGFDCCWLNNRRKRGETFVDDDGEEKLVTELDVMFPIVWLVLAIMTVLLTS